LQRQVDWVQASLGQLHIMSEGLNIFGQGNVGQVMVVLHQGSGKWVQVASGAHSLSTRMVGRGEGMGVGVRAADKWIVDAGRYGIGKSASHLIQGAKKKLCLLLHEFGWERVLGQDVWSPEAGGGKHGVV